MDFGDKVHVSQLPTKVTATKKIHFDTAGAVPVYFRPPSIYPKGQKFGKSTPWPKTPIPTPRQDLWLKLERWQIGLRGK